MDHTKLHHSQGSALLMAVLFMSIILTLILSTQVIMIRQNYNAIYGDGRTEQTTYNALANISNSIWNFVNRDLIGLPGIYESEGVRSVAGTPDLINNTLDIQSGTLDIRRQLQAQYQTQISNNINNGNIVLMLDQSGSTAIDNFDRQTYTACIQGTSSACTCLISATRPTCQPFNDIYLSADEFLNALNSNVTNPGPGVTWKYDLIDKLTFIISPNNSTNTGFIAGPQPLVADYEGDKTPFINFTNTNYILPSGQSTLGDVVSEVTQNSANYFTTVDPLDPTDNTFNFLIVITDGAPTTAPGATPPTCVDPYEGSRIGVTNPCIPQRTRIQELLTNHNNTNSNTSICTLVLGYGNYLDSSSGVYSEHAHAFITGSNNTTPNITNSRTNGRCPDTLDLDAAAGIQHYHIVNNLSEISAALAQIANRTADSLRSITIRERDPDATLNP